MRPIGTLRSCYGQKFGIPRQPGLVPEASAELHLDPAVVTRDAVRGLERFSHVWVIFLFHAAGEVKMVVRPPRLGGAKKTGVLATRSPHRPNHVGLSAVRLERVDADAPGGPVLHLRGGDFLDGTPVIDVKPYLPYADVVPDATSGWAEGELARAPVRFSEEARAACARAEAEGFADLARIVEASLALDPRRPRARDGTYAMRLGHWDVHCAVDERGWEVVRLVDLRTGEGEESG